MVTAAHNVQVKHDCASTKGQSGASMYDSDYRVRAIITAGSDSQNYAIQARLRRLCNAHFRHMPTPDGAHIHQPFSMQQVLSSRPGGRSDVWYLLYFCD